METLPGRLREEAVADDFNPAAREQSAEHSGRFWVMSAIVEAVEAGSPFVSPRRVRRICERWRLPRLGRLAPESTVARLCAAIEGTAPRRAPAVC